MDFEEHDRAVIESLEAELTRLRADLEKAKEALRPFAVAYVGREAWHGDYSGHMPIRSLDLRTAARTLSQLENSK